jgi:amino-acid N-acetyltransferase
MVAIEYIKPTLKHIGAMQELVAEDVNNGRIIFRNSDEMANTIRSYTLALDGDKAVGFVALHIYTPSLAEVRSLIVDKHYRNTGIGKQLVLRTLSEAKTLGIKTLFALTYEPKFFEKIGFTQTLKEDLPEQKIWADCIKCKHFPICDETALTIQI